MARSPRQRQVSQSEAPLTTGLIQPMKFQAQGESESESAENLVPHESRFRASLAAVPVRSVMSTVIQPKLTIGAPNDKYEQEADRVAQQVVQRLHAPKLERPQSGDTVQREVEPDEDEELQMKPLLQRQGGGRVAASDELESAIQHSRGGGQPLAKTVREPMEQAFGGVDFSGVKVHRDAQSDQLNQLIQAKAFTTGQDVYFRQGAYEPGSRSGQELMAHELTHVVQQKGREGHAPSSGTSALLMGHNTFSKVLQRFYDKSSDSEEVDEARIASATIETLQDWESRTETGDWEADQLVPSAEERKKIQSRIAELQALRGAPPLQDPSSVKQQIETRTEQTEKAVEGTKSASPQKRITVKVAATQAAKPPLGWAFENDLPKHGNNKTRSVKSGYPHVSILLGEWNKKKGTVEIQDFHYSVGASSTHFHWKSQGKGKYKLSNDLSQIRSTGIELLRRAYNAVNEIAAKYDCTINRPDILGPE